MLCAYVQKAHGCEELEHLVHGVQDAVGRCNRGKARPLRVHSRAGVCACVEQARSERASRVRGNSRSSSSSSRARGMAMIRRGMRVIKHREEGTERKGRYPAHHMTRRGRRIHAGDDGREL